MESHIFFNNGELTIDTPVGCLAVPGVNFMPPEEALEALKELAAMASDCAAKGHDDDNPERVAKRNGMNALDSLLDVEPKLGNDLGADDVAFLETIARITEIGSADDDDDDLFTEAVTSGDWALDFQALNAMIWLRENYPEHWRTVKNSYPEQVIWQSASSGWFDTEAMGVDPEWGPRLVEALENTGVVISREDGFWGIPPTCPPEENVLALQICYLYPK